MQLAQALASAVTLVRHRFPAASVSLNPWRDDPQTRQWKEDQTLDLAFHFPGWSPSLECRSLLLQLRLQRNSDDGESLTIFINKAEECLFMLHLRTHQKQVLSLFRFIKLVY